MKHWQNLNDVGTSDYYSVHRLVGDDGGMRAMRELFPNGDANELNFVLFSTSGIHGTYCTIEACEAGDVRNVTFLIIQPRIVALRYGNCEPKTPEDFAFLKRLRASSIRAVESYGLSPPVPHPEAAQKPGENE